MLENQLMEKRIKAKAHAWDALATKLGAKEVYFQGRFGDKIPCFHPGKGWGLETTQV